MTEKMYDDLMEHIDDLETMHFADSLAFFYLRQAIKNSEKVAVILYNYYGLGGDHDEIVSTPF